MYHHQLWTVHCGYLSLSDRCMLCLLCQIRVEKYAPCLVLGQHSAFLSWVKYDSTWDWGNMSSLLPSVVSIVKIFPFFILFATELPITLLSRHQFQSSSDVHLPPQWHKSLQRVFLHTPCQRDGQYHGWVEVGRCGCRPRLSLSLLSPSHLLQCTVLAPKSWKQGGGLFDGISQCAEGLAS